jgi:hypothetical protein
VKLWNFRTGEELATLKGHTRRVNALALGDDILCTGSRDGTVLVWSREGPEKLEHYLVARLVHTAPVSCTLLDGDLLYVGYRSGEIKVWSIKTAHCLYTWEAHSHRVSSIGVYRDYFFSACSHLRIWKRTPDLKFILLQEFRHEGGAVISVDFAGRIYSGSSREDSVKFWNWTWIEDSQPTKDSTSSSSTHEDPQTTKNSTSSAHEPLLQEDSHQDSQGSQDSQQEQPDDSQDQAPFQTP